MKTRSHLNMFYNVKLVSEADSSEKDRPEISGAFKTGELRDVLSLIEETAGEHIRIVQ